MDVISLDLSLPLIMLLVWSVYFLLKKNFFDPINKILDKREAAINGALKEAQEKLSLYDQKSQVYQDSLKGARLESYRQQESFRVEAMSERSHILADGRAKAERILNSAREEIEAGVTTAKKSLEADVNEIADGIVKTVLR